MDETRKSFAQCKNALADTAQLAHPRPHAALRLCTDASTTAVGAILEHSVNDVWKPLGFFSKNLTKTQSRYSTYDRELLVAVLGTRHFLHAIERRVTTLRTDHKPLMYMFTQKHEKYDDRQVRHISFLSQYIHSVEHVQGEKNVIPDALSRFESAAVQYGLSDTANLVKDQAADVELQDILSGSTQTSLQLHLQDTPVGGIYVDYSTGVARTYVPSIHRRSVFLGIHGQAHGGLKTTLRLIKSRFCCPGMDREIRLWTTCCESCQRSKVHCHTRSPIAPFAPPERRFGHIHLDLVGPLPPSNGHKYLLTCIDRYTRWPEAWPMVNISAHAVTMTLVDQWIARFGVPDVITTDQGRQFEADLFKTLTVIFGIRHTRTSPYHPQANRMVERLHRTLKASLTA